MTDLALVAYRLAIIAILLLGFIGIENKLDAIHTAIERVQK